MPTPASEKQFGNSSEILISKTYLSRAVRPFIEEDLESLLVNCRENNAKVNVTGALLHHNDYFMQLLEGTSVEVEAVYARIAADPRHEVLSILFEDEISARFFPDWSMGYRAANMIPSKALNQVYESAKFDSKRFPINDFLMVFSDDK